MALISLVFEEPAWVTMVSWASVLAYAYVPNSYVLAAIAGLRPPPGATKAERVAHFKELGWLQFKYRKAVAWWDVVIAMNRSTVVIIAAMVPTARRSASCPSSCALAALAHVSSAPFRSVHQRRDAGSSRCFTARTSRPSRWASRAPLNALELVNILGTIAIAILGLLHDALDADVLVTLARRRDRDGSGFGLVGVRGFRDERKYMRGEGGEDEGLEGSRRPRSATRSARPSGLGGGGVLRQARRG